MSQPDVDKRIELVAIINSFNRRALLQPAVESLAVALRKAQFGSAIIVFDAGSDDGSREFLIQWSQENPGDNLTVIAPSDGRASFSEGVNTACATALTRFPDCRWLFLYESDNWLGNVSPVEQAIALLNRQPHLAAVGFTVRKHNRESFGYGMRFPSPLSLALGQNVAFYYNLHAPNECPWEITDGVRWRICDVVFTSPLVIRRQPWEESRGFDARVFPFSDTDLDWAWRCAKLGWKLAVIETDEVVHDNLDQFSSWSATRVVDFHRNRLRLLKRHLGKHVAVIKPLLFLRHLVEAMILAGKSASDPQAKQKLTGRMQMLRTVWSDYR
jgi:GT2 family glycosyltransferase